MAIDLPQANAIKLKLYLEGIEVACSSAQIVESQGKAPKATVKIPVNDLALNIEPRTTVHLFYKDTSLPEYVLVFEGEVASLNINKHFEQREVTLSCVHITDHWNYVTKSPNLLSNPAGEIGQKIRVTFGQEMDEPIIPADIRENIELIDAIKQDTSGFEKYHAEVETIQARHQRGELTDAERDEQFANLASASDSAQLAINLATGILDNFKLQEAIFDILKKENNKIGSVISRFSNDFARTNLGYANFHVVYQIARRVFGFDNARLETLITSKQTLDFISQDLNQASGTTTLISLILQFLDIFNYKFIAPAAQTYNEARKVPETFIALPTPTQFSPIAANVFFKDNVINASYSRNYLSEPTRLGSHLVPTVERNADDAITAFNEIVIAPAGQISYTPSAKPNRTTEITPFVQMTRKERMRGINGQIVEDDFSIIKARIDAKRVAADTPEDETEEQVDGLIRDFRTRYIDSQYQNRVLSARTFALTTTYSPHRVCGLPGLYMDDVLPCVIGTIQEIVSSLDPNGTAMSQITFSYPKAVRPEDKIVPANKDSLEEWLILYGMTKEDATNDAELSKRWPFTDEEWSDDTAKQQRWINYLRHKINNPDTLVFLESWYDHATFFPDQIGRKVYRQIMYGLPYVATSSSIPDFADADNTTRFKTTINENLDGGIGRYKKDSNYFTVDTHNNVTNTQLIAHYIKTLQDRYEALGDERKKDFVDKFIRRRLVTEKEYWKFFINLGKTESVNKLETLNVPDDTSLGRGIRSIDVSMASERERIKELIDLNMGTDSVPASAPFIQGRREIIKKLRDSLLYEGHYIGGNT